MSYLSKIKKVLIKFFHFDIEIEDDEIEQIGNVMDEDIDKIENAIDHVEESIIEPIEDKTNNVEVKEMDEQILLQDNTEINEDSLKTSEVEVYKEIKQEETKIPSKYILSQIRLKIRENTIQISDIEEIKEQLSDCDKKMYYLVLAAAYDRLGQKENAINCIKQMEKAGIEFKGLGQVKEQLKRKNRMFFMDRWDKVIGWDLSLVREDNKDNKDRKKGNKRKKKDKNIKVLPDSIDCKNKKTVVKTSIDENYSNVAKEPEDKYTTSVIEPHKKSKTRKQSDEKEKRTILMDLDVSLKEIINKINCKYYIEMQPTSKESMLPKEYYEALEGIKNVRGEEKLRRMSVMQESLKEGYINSRIRKEYTKKYDKLQSVLECDSTNKRAQMELILILINEGYEEEVKDSFNKEDYEFIHNIIMQFDERKIKLQDARNSIDEYCL